MTMPNDDNEETPPVDLIETVIRVASKSAEATTKVASGLHATENRMQSLEDGQNRLSTELATLSERVDNLVKAKEQADASKAEIIKSAMDPQTLMIIFVIISTTLGGNADKLIGLLGGGSP